MRHIKTAICQIFTLEGDRRGNFVRIENAVREAKAAGANLACLPEMAILGWVNPDAHKRAYPIPGPDSDRLCKLAGDFDIYLCVGLAEKAGGGLYDSAILIDAAGHILLKHRKINLLAELMTPPYTPGKDIHTVETTFGRIGLLICADDPILKRMAALKPDLLLVPYGYAAAEEEWPGHGKVLENVVRHTARRTGACVIGTNLVGQISNGPWKGRVYGGHSVAVDKTGRVLSTATDRDRDISIVEIDV
jgi:predicted amidohydrolase